MALGSRVLGFRALMSLGCRVFGLDGSVVLYVFKVSWPPGF